MNVPAKRRLSFNGNVLKIIAIFLMLIDHIAVVFIERRIPEITDYIFKGEGLKYTGITLSRLSNLNLFMRGLGRPSFIIFCFLLVEGYLHTGNLIKYSLRLFVFALISELPFDLALYPEDTELIKQGFVPFLTGFHSTHQNVMFTLLIGLGVISGLDYLSRFRLRRERFEKPVRYLLSVTLITAGCILAWIIRADYDVMGIAFIVVIYMLRDQRLYQWVGLLLVILTGIWFGTDDFLQLCGLLAYFPILLYNGERGSFRFKYVFYGFYPVHLMLLWFIAGYMIK